jgi:hypothetical protein
MMAPVGLPGVFRNRTRVSGPIAALTASLSTAKSVAHAQGYGPHARIDGAHDRRVAHVHRFGNDHLVTRIEETGHHRVDRCRRAGEDRHFVHAAGERRRRALEVRHRATQLQLTERR